MHRGISTGQVLVLGDGQLGSELVKQTGWDYISRKKDGFDISKVSSLNNYVLHHFTEIGEVILQYNTIVNCIADTSTYSDDREPHWNINYKFAAELTDYCNDMGIKLIHISTDHVYVNSLPKASEETVPANDRNWYGYTKLVADAYVQLRSNNYLIIRESHKPYPFPWAQAWRNQSTNGDYTPKIASLIIKLIKTNANGVFNVGTEEKTWYDLTKYEFGTKPVAKPAFAPEDITMNIDKLTTWLSKN
jgi:dTDP-4-dehydrorhamnose reductase